MSETQENEGFPLDLHCSILGRSPPRISWESTGDDFTWRSPVYSEGLRMAAISGGDRRGSGIKRVVQWDSPLMIWRVNSRQFLKAIYRAIPDKIESIFERITQELENTEQAATQGLTLVRALLFQFVNNALLIQYFAYLNAVLVFVKTSKRQTQTTVEAMSPADVPPEVIEEAGEDLGTLLGPVVETKIEVKQILNRLEGLR
ncbi:hypothetical protein [Laspinema olomoucense]|uniref:hypothetical protein n=1 Tax=Laspinema olomoucense TaxID=3231600 RepID=UPI0021BB5803|nr:MULTISPECIES: hypothetical protein [unclassified Laspinema]MCT7991386.1 hypothetical protein [Laspinema sp. D3a]MCT7996018.1 hypothetical protein [Laspinema sp. D3c]